MKRKAASPVVETKLNKFPKKDTEEKQQVVIHWLRQNYYLGCGGSTPKAQLFQEYLNMCRDENIEATSNSAFGKLVRTAFPGVQSSRKGPRGAAKHQYKNLLPRTDKNGHPSPLPIGSVEQDDEYEGDAEEMSSSSSSSSAAAASSSSSSPSYGSSSSPVSSPSQYHQIHLRPFGFQEPSGDPSFYFSAAPGPAPSSPFSAAEESELLLPCTSSSSSAPMAPYAGATTTNSAPCCLHYHQPFMAVPYNAHHELPSEGTSSSFDDIDAYGAEAAAAAEQGVWEGEDAEAFFSFTASPFPDASAFLLPPSIRGFVSTLGDGAEDHFGTSGFVDGLRREEEAQLMWCSSAGLEDILSASKGDEWINNLLQGCN